jgi:hypothetical protein
MFRKGSEEEEEEGRRRDRWEGGFWEQYHSIVYKGIKFKTR